MAKQGSANGKIGVGIIGTGGIAHLHAAACAASPHLEIVGLADIRKEVAEAFAKRFDLDVPVFDGHTELLAMDGLDAVTVATPNDVHASISIDALEAGKHTLCEKPMSSNITDAEAMVAAAKKSGLTNMIGYTKRHFSGTRFLHDYLRREDLGRVYHFRAYYLQGWLSNPTTPAPWRLKKEHTGTGALGDLASHITDLARFLLGDDITRVTGMMKTFVHERPDRDDLEVTQNIEVDDAVMFGAEFKGGAMGVFEASRNGTARPDHWRIEIDAELGAVTFDRTDGIVRLALAQGPSRRAGWVEIPIPARYGAAGSEFENEFNHFAECIQTGQTPDPSFENAFKTEQVLNAVLRSSEAGKAVDV